MMRLLLGTLVLLSAAVPLLALSNVEELYVLADARNQVCQAYDGSNNWGVFHDNYARQNVLWSQDGTGLRLWDVSPATTANTCGQPPLLASFPTPDGSCPYLNTQHSRDFFRSTHVPTVCNNCTPSAVDVCEYQLQVSDVRCGSPYKLWISQSPAWPIGQRLGDGQQVSGPGRVAMDSDLSNGSSASDACSPLVNADQMAGHWCVVTRGPCSADSQVRNCFGGNTSNPAGVLGVIVIDSATGTSRPSSGAILAPISFPLMVPLIMVSRADGEKLAGSWSSSVFTISKAIGPVSYQRFPRTGILTREHRTGTVYDSASAPRPTAYRFFAEPNRLLGWAFGMQAADGTTNNVGLFDLRNTDTPVLLQQWTYAQAGLPVALNWSPSTLVFGQHVGVNYFWVVADGPSFRFWNVTDLAVPQWLSSSIPRRQAGGGAFLDQSAQFLWQQVSGWRQQEAWSISDLLSPRLLGAFALDTSLYTPSRGGYVSFQYPTFGSWGSHIVSFNLGDNGIGFYNYSDPINVTLAAYRDTSPSSCSPLGVGGPQGAIVPSPEQGVWFACRPWEPQPWWSCGKGRVEASITNQTTCESVPFRPRYDLVAYRISPQPEKPLERCDDGAIVNMFFLRDQ